MKTDEIIVRVVFILILIVMIAGYQNGRQLNNKLIASRIVLCAEVVSVKPDKGGGLLAGIYNYEGKVYKKKYSCLNKTKREYESGRKKILIVVQKGNALNTELLETKEDFQKYNIKNIDTIGLHCSW